MKSILLRSLNILILVVLAACSSIAPSPTPTPTQTTTLTPVPTTTQTLTPTITATATPALPEILTSESLDKGGWDDFTFEPTDKGYYVARDFNGNYVENAEFDTNGTVKIKYAEGIDLVQPFQAVSSAINEAGRRVLRVGPWDYDPETRTWSETYSLTAKDIVEGKEIDWSRALVIVKGLEEGSTADTIFHARDLYIEIHPVIVWNKSMLFPPIQVILSGLVPDRVIYL